MIANNSLLISIQTKFFFLRKTNKKKTIVLFYFQWTCVHDIQEREMLDSVDESKDDDDSSSSSHFNEIPTMDLDDPQPQASRTGSMVINSAQRARVVQTPSNVRDGFTPLDGAHRSSIFRPRITRQETLRRNLRARGSRPERTSSRMDLGLSEFRSSTGGEEGSRQDERLNQDERSEEASSTRAFGECDKSYYFYIA